MDLSSREKLLPEQPEGSRGKAETVQVQGGSGPPGSALS
jgi:hypothetical protein